MRLIIRWFYECDDNWGLEINFICKAFLLNKIKMFNNNEDLSFKFIKLFTFLRHILFLLTWILSHFNIKNPCYFITFPALCCNTDAKWKFKRAGYRCSPLECLRKNGLFKCWKTKWKMELFNSKKITEFTF